MQSKAKVIIQDMTTKDPITLIGKESGICYNADISDKEKNYKRGLNCLKSGHGRTFEFPDVYMVLDGWSARVIREFYTHIGGAPTRLQESTRYVKYDNPEYYVPTGYGEEHRLSYIDAMDLAFKSYKALLTIGFSREDAANVLPLGMATKVVVKMNLRTLMDMSKQRLCNRAYKEFRVLMSEIGRALAGYSDEWNEIVSLYFKPKCEFLGYCPEEKGCGKYPRNNTD